MTTIESEKLQQIKEDLPWYINGTLASERIQEIEQAISNSDELRAEVKWLKSLQKNIADEKMHMPDDIGINTFNALIKSEKKGNVVSLHSRWQQWQRPLMAIAATVMVVQMGIIGTLIHNQPIHSITTLSGETVSSNREGVLLQVVFSDTATAADIRESLNKIKGDIISGPGAMGIYTVHVPTQNATNLITQLRDQTSIESVTLLDE